MLWCCLLTHICHKLCCSSICMQIYILQYHIHWIPDTRRIPGGYGYGSNFLPDWLGGYGYLYKGRVLSDPNTTRPAAIPRYDRACSPGPSGYIGFPLLLGRCRAYRAQVPSCPWPESSTAGASRDAGVRRRNPAAVECSPWGGCWGGGTTLYPQGELTTENHGRPQPPNGLYAEKG
jgi:hypothetical protein